MVGSIHHPWDRPDLKEIDFEELGEGFTRQGSQTRKLRRYDGGTKANWD